MLWGTVFSHEENDREAITVIQWAHEIFAQVDEAEMRLSERIDNFRDHFDNLEQQISRLGQRLAPQDFYALPPAPTQATRNTITSRVITRRPFQPLRIRNVPAREDIVEL